MRKMSRIQRCLACLFVLFSFGSAYAAGYTCSTKKYTSCNKNYYLSECGTTYDGRTLSASSLKAGNSCKTCPSGYTCTGGLVCPKKACVQITLDPFCSGQTAKTLYKNGTTWYTDSACTTKWTGSSSIVPVCPNDTGWEFRGYVLPKANDITSSAAAISNQYITRSGNPTTTGNNWSPSDNTTLYAAWAKKCKTTTGCTCSLAVSDNGAAVYSTTAKPGYLFSGGGGTYAPSCTACPDGTYKPGTSSATSCSTCPSGWTVDSTRAYCRKTFTLNKNGGNDAACTYNGNGCNSSSLTYSCNYGSTCNFYNTKTQFNGNSSVPALFTAGGNNEAIGGWGTSPTCNDTKYSFTSDEVNNMTAGTTYYACKTYKVTFDLNSGSNNKPADVYATYGVAMPALSTTANPTRTGYTFGGWYDSSATAGGTQYYTSARASARTWDKSAAPTTLYARWTGVTSTVSLNPNGGTAGNVTSVIATYGSAMPSVINPIGRREPTRAGYIFAGFYDTSASTGGTQYYTFEMGSAHIWDKTDTTVTLYARWMPCADGTYAAAGASKCTACPAATDSSWTVRTGATGATSWSACYEEKSLVGDPADPDNDWCATGSIIRRASSASAYSSTITEGSKIYAFAGKYFDKSRWSCPRCAVGTYSAGGLATSCTACPAATDSSWSVHTDAVGATSWSACYERKELGGDADNIQEDDWCDAAILIRPASSASAYGEVDAIRSDIMSFPGGYVDKSNKNEWRCTMCAAGTYSAGGRTATSCTTCPAGTYCPAGAGAATKCAIGSFSAAGAAVCTACGDGANWGKTTTAAGSASCNKDCGIAGAKGYGDAKWNSNNTVTGLCVPNSCVADYYLDAVRDSSNTITSSSCKLCSSFADGLYPHSPNSGTAGGKEACFARRSELNGYHIAKAGDEVKTPCGPGYYTNYAGDEVVHYGERYDCKTCAANTYSDKEANTTCTACLDGYETFGEKTSESACRIRCAGGSYIKTARATECSPVGAGYWAAAAYVTQGAAGTRNQCATGLTTIGYGAGADEADDCGHIMYVNGGKLYLRGAKKTTPSLNIKIGSTTFYGNMSTEDKYMSDGNDKKLKVKNGAVTYNVYDDSGEFYTGGGASATTKIDASLAATTIVPAAYNTAAGETTWSATLSDGTAVTGNAKCSATTGTNGDISAAGFTPEGTGTGCWCQIATPAKGSKWVFGTTNASCVDKCGYYCANNMKGTAAKNITYRTNLYNTAGILKQ